MSASGGRAGMTSGMVVTLPALGIAWMVFERVATGMWMVLLLSGLCVAGGAAGAFAGAAGRALPRHPVVPSVVFWLAGATLGCVVLVLAFSVDIAARNGIALEDAVVAWSSSAVAWTLLVFALCLIGAAPSAIAWPMTTGLIERRVARGRTMLTRPPE